MQVSFLHRLLELEFTLSSPRSFIVTLPSNSFDPRRNQLPEYMTHTSFRDYQLETGTM